MNKEKIIRDNKSKALFFVPTKNDIKIRKLEKKINELEQKIFKLEKIVNKIVD